MQHQPTAADDLAWTRQHWDDLHAMLTTTGATTWPPTTLRDYLARLEDAQRDQYTAAARAERAERTEDAPGVRPVPVDLAVVDTIRAVEAGLCSTADHLAAWQPTDLPYTSRWRGRWAHDTSWRHGVPWACTYLEAALEWLPRLQADQVVQAAAEARRRVAQALGDTRRRDTARHPCPWCSGVLTLTHGGEALPEARCAGCGRSWRGANLVQLHDAMRWGTGRERRSRTVA